MFIVKIYDGPDDALGTTIHTPNNSETKVSSGTINKEINMIDSFNFSILPNNPAYGQIKPYKTLVSVYNTKTREYDFEGRVYQPSESMGSDGDISYGYTAEGELAYLHDSVQRHVEFRGTPTELFTTLLNYHNTQVEEYKRFEVGTVTVTDPNNYIYLYLTAEENTWEAVNRALIDKLGGELLIRKVNGVRYLDYVERIGIDSNVPIQLSKNLVSVSRDIDPSSIITRLTPLGTRLESEEENENEESTQTVSEPRLTVEEVNNSIPYLDRPDLIEAFGIQGGSEVWDDVTTADMLKTRGQQFLDNQKLVLYQYTIDVLDLFLIGLDPTGFHTGNSHLLINPVMNILGEQLRIIKQSIDINNPQNGSLTVGDKFKTATDFQVDMNKETRHIYNLESQLIGLSRQTGTMRTNLGKATNSLGVVQQQLNSVDKDSWPESLQEINRQIQNVQSNINDIDLPDTSQFITVEEDQDTTYSAGDNVTIDSDNRINAVDTTYEVATDSKDGLMSSEDKQKLDNIEIVDYTDNFNQINNTLINLTNRIEDLENGGVDNK